MLVNCLKQVKTKTQTPPDSYKRVLVLYNDRLDAGHMTSLAIKQLLAVRKIEEYLVKHEESKCNICLSIEQRIFF